MLKKELNIALALVGTMVPCIAQADQPMAGSQNQPSQKQSTYVAGEKVKEGQLPGAYNQSASYVIDSGYDVYLTADYLYWHLSREGDASNNNNQSYKSGFQVGLGFDMNGMDDWNMYGEYTWYQNKENDHSDHKFSYNDAFWTLARPFYFGKKLTANFSAGLRGLWISDQEHHANQKSWALGPRFGFDSNWLLGGGFKILGNISQSVLYTRYTEVSGVAISGHDGYNTLRAVTDTFLGLGWGSYFGDQDDFHFDLTVGYDFNIYWNQHLGTYDSVGNDYLQGLNVGIRLDF